MPSEVVKDKTNLTDDWDLGASSTVKKPQPYWVYEPIWVKVGQQRKLFHLDGPEIGFRSRFQVAGSHQEIESLIHKQWESIEKNGNYGNHPIAFEPRMCLMSTDFHRNKWMILYEDRIVAEDVPLGEVLRAQGSEAFSQLLSHWEKEALAGIFIEKIPDPNLRRSR